MTTSFKLPWQAKYPAQPEEINPNVNNKIKQHPIRFDFLLKINKKYKIYAKNFLFLKNIYLIDVSFEFDALLLN